ncbi:MAG: hypothetical protein AABZ44_07070 [Elusimicrobiota bacterium]
MHRTQVYFRQDQHLLLKREAARRGQSMTDYLRELIDQHLVKIKRPSGPNLACLTTLGASKIKNSSSRHNEVFAKMAVRNKRA